MNAGVFTEIPFYLRTQKQKLDKEKALPPSLQRLGRGSAFPALEGGTKPIPRKNLVLSVRWTPTFPLRGLVREEVNDLLHGKSSSKLPFWAVIGPATESLGLEDLKLRRKVVRVIKVLHPNLIAWARAQGFDPHLPRFAGGLGLPERSPLAKTVSLQSRKLLAVLAYGSSPKDLISL